MKTKILDNVQLNRRDFIKNSLCGALTVASLSSLHGCAGASLNLKEDIAKIEENPDRRAHHRSYMDAYKFDECIECGECLHGCNYKTLDQEQAIQNIKAMRRGDAEICDEMLDQCALCYKCNHRCPQDAKPVALMLERLRDRREREGYVASSMRYMFNGMEEKGWSSNFFRDLYSAQYEEEYTILERWAEPKDCGDGDLLWCSCATRIFPYDIEHSPILADLQKFGGESDCCGLGAFRSGLFDVARYVSNNLIDRLSECRFKRLVVLCGSCQEMFQIAFPNYIGQEFPFEVISIYEYLDEQMQKGKISIQRKVPDEEKETCISHSCFTLDFGEEYEASVQRLAKAVGFNSVELEHNGEKNACCGMGGYFRQGNLWDIFDVMELKETDIEKSERDNILTYCYGCFILTNMFQSGTTHHLLEKLLWATGQEIEYPLSGIFGRSFNLRSFFHMMQIGPSAMW
jgi:Fe-S oxidoreductase